MEATFVLDAQEDRMQFAERLTRFFAGKTIRVRVEEVANEVVEQQSLVKRMEELRLLTEQVPVTLQPGIDINNLIDEVNE
ncbi:hypothetical protein [Spirosoma litoris]